ncbi:hypothetical protein NW754_008390 [Fusarium falciforme]|nr:hypothetical protein NW754_008390 [Fusarium falciforme]
MEVLGAVASGIAVVQALEAVRKTVGLIREIPEIQGDFDGLIKELDLTEAMAKVAQQIPSNSPEQDFLAKATEQVNEVTTELNKVLESCARGTDEADKKLWKTKKRKWLLEEQRILKLERKLQNAKGTLHLAMTSHGISSEAESATTHEFRQDHPSLMLKADSELGSRCLWTFSCLSRELKHWGFRLNCQDLNQLRSYHHPMP